MSKKGGKKTPKELDYIFERHLVKESDYAEFWRRWWEDEEIAEEYLDETGKEVEFVDREPISSYAVTRVKKTAEWQAKLLGGYVIRRNKQGKFSKRGKFYQAVRRKNVKGDNRGTRKRRK